MKKTTALIFCCALIFVSGDQTVDKPNTPSQPTTITPIISTKSTTTSSTTTSSTPTTTSTTKAPKTTTTTVAPPPTTTHAPTPAKDPESHKWFLNGTDNNTIVVQWAVQLNVTYNSTNEKKLSAAINVPVDNNTQVAGTFAPNDETMMLSWKSAGDKLNVVSLHFKKDNKSSTYILNSLEASISPDELPNSGLNSSLKLVHTQEHFNTSLGNSYRCLRLMTFNMTKENDKETVAYMKVSNLRFQAFKTDNNKNFGLAEDCAFDTPDVVPIAVGCVLAGLVVIVLIAYLVSRRSQARGYLSM